MIGGKSIVQKLPNSMSSAEMPAEGLCPPRGSRLTRRRAKCVRWSQRQLVRLEDTLLVTQPLPLQPPCPPDAHRHTLMKAAYQQTRSFLSLETLIDPSGIHPVQQKEIIIKYWLTVCLVIPEYALDLILWLETKSNRGGRRSVDGLVVWHKPFQPKAVMFSPLWVFDAWASQ